VGLICATVPIVAAIMSQIILKEKNLNSQFLTGTIMAFLGVTLVVLNGNFILKLNPLGDFLTFLAVISWGIYCVSIRLFKHQYNSLFITRKIFFYSILTLLPYFIFKPFHFHWSRFLQTEVWGNLIFLGLIASSLCYLVWTAAIKRIGVVATNNYIYFMPIVTIITANIFLEEQISFFILIGAIFIVGGLWWTTADMEKIQTHLKRKSK
jgi:drug/metabolite transporter (DMT)-like permease